MGGTRLTLGPLLFNWPAEKRRDFYFRIADEAPVDTVCLGEVVCSKRTPFILPDLPEIIERLEASGKEVVHSTLALILSGSEMDEARGLAEDPDFLIEANDVSTAAMLRGRPHVIGPYVNVYNEGTLDYLVRQGAVRVCLPAELSATAIGVLAGAKLAEIEVTVFGRAPLAISARCYHARAHGLHKDGCQYVCDRDPDGMTVESMTGQEFLAVNGLQTMSHSYVNLAGEVGSLLKMGVGGLRLSPHDLDMAAIAQVFRDLSENRMEAGAAVERLETLCNNAPFSNGFFHGVEGLRQVEEAE